jgi:hypothetical protein
MHRLSDLTIERRNRPLYNAIRALGMDQQPHPISGAENARTLFPGDQKILDKTLEYIARGAVVPLDTTA